MTRKERTNIDAHLAIMRGLEIGLAAGITTAGELTTEVHKALQAAGVGFIARPVPRWANPEQASTGRQLIAMMREEMDADPDAVDEWAY